MAAALAVIILVPTVIGSFVYALPCMAGMLIMLCVIELDKKWAFGVYTASSIISFLVVSNKEAVLLYILFFGYYPILKSLFESKLCKVLEYLCKLLVFNVSLFLVYFILDKIFGMPLSEVMGVSDAQSFAGRYLVLIVFAVGNVFFVLYDFAVTKILTCYLLFFKKKFHKMFRFK